MPHTPTRIRRVAGIAALAVFGLTGTAWADDDEQTGNDQTAKAVSVPDTTAASRATCVHPLVENPFAGFGDLRDYVLAPGASFEDPTLPGWTLTGGAGVVEGNEPFNLRGGQDGHSLALPEETRATSATMCVDLHFPTMRFVALQQTRDDAELKVEVLYPEAAKPVWKKIKDLKARDRDGWQISDDIKIKPELGGKLAGARQVALRFTSDDEGSWLIDNVYIDPLRR